MTFGKFARRLTLGTVAAGGLAATVMVAETIGINAMAECGRASFGEVVSANIDFVRGQGRASFNRLSEGLTCQ